MGDRDEQEVYVLAQRVELRVTAFTEQESRQDKKIQVYVGNYPCLFTVCSHCCLFTVTLFQVGSLSYARALKLRPWMLCFRINSKNARRFLPAACAAFVMFPSLATRSPLMYVFSN